MNHRAVSRASRRKSKLKQRVSSIDQISIEDIDEMNFQDTLEVVLNMASKECKEVENEITSTAKVMLQAKGQLLTIVAILMRSTRLIMCVGLN